MRDFVMEKETMMWQNEQNSMSLSDCDNYNNCIVKMGTVGGEPRFLLNALKPMLGIYGDIKTPQEVLRVVNLMKDAEKLMSRCIYLNVLRATCSRSKNTEVHGDTLDRFLLSGGWGILNKWLNEYTKSENSPILVELLEVLRFLPVTIDILKQGNTGKIIKLLTKYDDPDVRRGAMQLIKQWKGMIRGGNSEKGSKNNSTDLAKKAGEDSPGGAGKRARQGSTDEKLPPEKKAKQSEEKKEHKKEKIQDPKVAVESFGFMNAIVAVAKPVKKKKKLVSPKTTLPLDEILSNKNLDGDKNAEPPYSSPLREDQDSKDKVIDTNGEGNNNDQSQKTDPKDTNGEKMDESSNDSSQPLSTKKKKKSITWAEEDNLAQIFYFELDEEERAAMHHTVNFMTAKHNELIREREALESARRTGEDRMVEKLTWRRPGYVEMTSLPVEPGEKSREKYIQKEREQKVLADIFLTKASLPDSPAEPDMENEEHGPSEPKLIPHDEEGTFYPKPSIPLQQQTSSSSSSSATISSQSTNDTKAKGNGSSLLGDPPAEMIANMKDKDMSPAVHNIMKQIMVGPGPPQDYPHPSGPEFMGRGGRPMGPDGFGGPHRFPLRGGPRQPMMPYQGRPRGNFRGRPMAPRGGPMRPRFHGPPMGGMQGGMQGGNEEHYDGGYHEEEQHYRVGRGRGRGGPPPRGRGKREPPMCRHYMTASGCRNGNNCHFQHPSKNGPPR
eukprot:Seg543.6 transcript_id=Seg543.6/GoldUCD/mRNA.D3Y31 product="Serine/threonine-protein phosphatase 1 regulatory subunit 10" protein_id=Seg543.6/GoldUCD/D3Y31